MHNADSIIQIKSLSGLRSSDRRKLADQIIKEFELEAPPPTNSSNEGSEETSGAAPPNNISVLRNALLPDNTLSGRFTTTAGPDLKTVSGVIYVGAHPGEELRVLWFKIYERLLPTVYTLWHNPKLVPLLYTPSNVLFKLQGGADLMTPGLALGPPFPSKAKKDAIVAIASLDLPTVPLVVGICEIDVNELQAVRGEKGKAVRGIHWSGDELWAWSSGGNPGGLAPKAIEGWGSEHIESTQPSEGVGEMKLVPDHDYHDDEIAEDGGVRLSIEETPIKPFNDIFNGENAEILDHEDKEVPTKEIDTAFINAFLFSLHRRMSTIKGDPSYGLKFPLSLSFVMSDLVIPFLPIHTPSEAANLQIKKTSWKNAKKFIKHLEKMQVIRAKDRNGGETVILDIEFTNNRVQDFIPYKLPTKKETSDTAKIDASDSTADNSVGQQLKRIIAFRPDKKLSQLFEVTGVKMKGLYLATEMKEIINSYIEHESLTFPTNKRLVKLDPYLSDVAFNINSALDCEVLSKGSVPRDALAGRLMDACAPYWQILRNEEPTDQTKPVPGTPPAILILLETRSGNKTVTKVSGVEAYHIRPQPLADELQKTCASSTSVGQLVGSSPKTPVMEILVQGPQTRAVLKTLERRGVREQWVKVVDKTKGKKMK
ncbi:MAG: hypothetical protein M1829_003716 [Trizodia sp. TS-e1964]|nr:MAG: hypothetical protein M1829_003716 [Trizodia sp. TS-e1964]